jgi:hypothetical protein
MGSAGGVRAATESNPGSKGAAGGGAQATDQVRQRAASFPHSDAAAPPPDPRVRQRPHFDELEPKGLEPGDDAVQSRAVAHVPSEDRF